MTGLADSSIDQAAADAIAIDAYIYLYPLVLMELTRRQMTNVASAGDVAGRGPANQFVHSREFPAADFRDVVKPNFDTLCSSAWLELSKEPLVISLPDAFDNYYLLALYDMWSEVFSSPGTRTTGSDGVDIALCGPGWSGEIPESLTRVDAPTPIVWAIGRTKASVKTYRDVREFQDEITVTPLSAWPKPAPPVHGTVDPNVDSVTPPLKQVFALEAKGFFELGAELLKQHAPHSADDAIIERIAKIGFVAGKSLDFDALDPISHAAFEVSNSAAPALITAHQQTLGKPHEGWLTAINSGAYGKEYLTRATTALIGLGANLPEDAIYPLSYEDIDGNPYTGESRYVLRFEADALPPAQAFWSLTLYDDEGFQVENELNRFAIGDRDELATGSDGSIELQIQREEPASGNTNWLPAPEGSFNLCLRIYYPEDRVLKGSWKTPGVRKV